jgi:hypothetical protein
MPVLGQEQILATSVGLAANLNVDFVLPKGASGVEVYIVSANPSTMSFTFGLAGIGPDGTVQAAKITSAAVSTATTTRIAVVPGIAAAANVSANDVMPGKARLVITRSTGSADISAYAVYFS